MGVVGERLYSAVMADSIRSARATVSDCVGRRAFVRLVSSYGQCGRLFGFSNCAKSTERIRADVWSYGALVFIEAIQATWPSLLLWTPFVDCGGSFAP